MSNKEELSGLEILLKEVLTECKKTPKDDDKGTDNKEMTDPNPNQEIDKSTTDKGKPDSFEDKSATVKATADPSPNEAEGIQTAKRGIEASTDTGSDAMNKTSKRQRTEVTAPNTISIDEITGHFYKNKMARFKGTKRGFSITRVLGINEAIQQRGAMQTYLRAQ
ncbi:Hypothetical predicted protein, partial [Olea europaea subsp. europaea]